MPVRPMCLLSSLSRRRFNLPILWKALVRRTRRTSCVLATLSSSRHRRLSTDESSGKPTAPRKGTLLVKDIVPGVSGSLIDNLVAVGSTLFFTATDGSHGLELWKSNGSADGTVMVKDIWPGTASASPSQLTAVGDRLFFTAADGVNGFELWTSDGSDRRHAASQGYRTGSGQLLTHVSHGVQRQVAAERLFDRLWPRAVDLGWDSRWNLLAAGRTGQCRDRRHGTLPWWDRKPSLWLQLPESATELFKTNGTPERHSTGQRHQSSGTGQ